VFTEIAAVCGVREVRGVFEFFGLDNPNGKMKLFGHFESFL
jgi:hypothetical protein